jgi:glycosyltransferase involved in cell wall biosynthesis
MKISVITVAFNAEQTIAETLNSVATQSHDNIEHIVVDGASTDDTLAIIKSHGTNVSKIISEPDQGLYDAMNKGISIATGEIIGILNADDIYAHSNVLQHIEYRIQNDNLDVLMGDVEFFRQDDPTKIIRRYRSNRFSPKRLAWGWMPAHPAMFLHRRVYERYGSYRIDYKIAADFEYVARIFHDYTLRYDYISEVLVRMRIGGISTDGWRSTLLLNREVLRACRDNDIKTNILMILSKYPAKFLEFLQK